MSTQTQNKSQNIPIAVPEQPLQTFCCRSYIRELSLFGSVLRDDFGVYSDLDILVEFEPDVEVDLLEFSGMRLELMDLFGREVDLATPIALKPLIKDEVLSNNIIIFAG